MKVNQNTSIFAKSKKGHAMSMLDCIVHALSPHSASAPWPTLTFGDITEKASLIAGYEIKGPAVRGYVYRRPDIFYRVENSPTVRWCLTHDAKEKLLKLRALSEKK